MRKFENLTLSEQQRIREFISDKIECETEEWYVRKSDVTLTVNSLEIKPLFSSKDEPHRTDVTHFHCSICDEPLDNFELIEHCMIHLKIE